MNSSIKTWAIALGLLLGMYGAVQARDADWVIRDGKFYDGGQWVFLKSGKPLLNYADPAQCDQFIGYLDTLQAKGYNSFELVCYWHQFETDGDGEIDVSLEPLGRVIDAIYERGMYPCLTVEVYAVGGGTMPHGMWERHPDMWAIDDQGHKIKDDEYGFGTSVPSIHCPAYQEDLVRFIRNLTAGLNHEKLLYFETTVEPQYMGGHALDYSVHARKAYADWLIKNGLEGPAFPEGFPVSGEFVKHPTWNRFRAEALADWINIECEAYRSVAGEDGYCAADYLETCNPDDMMRRHGNNRLFLGHLSAIDIIQVNWHWNIIYKRPNNCAYENVWDVMREKKYNWAVTEHMTINGSDYKPEEVALMMQNTLLNGTQFGWGFVNILPNSEDPFTVYNTDWSPKANMAVIDDNWEMWEEQIEANARVDALRPPIH